MSLVDLNDENCGVCPEGKLNSSSKDIFALDQPTGRPSILRQTENLPSKTVPKATKVCFQTPRRDPVTKRILSPSKSARMSSVDECAKAMESLHLDKSNSLQEATEQELSSYPDDDMPIQSKGGYQLDFDNLDAINPFQGSSKMVLSPAQPAVENHPAHHTEAQNATPENNKMESALEDTFPFIPSVENSVVDTSTNISSADSSVVTVRLPAVEEQDSYTTTPNEKLPADTSSSTDQDKVSGSFVEDSPLPPKGSYNLDFDNLEALNPFQAGGSKIQNSPVLGRKGSSIEPPTEKNEPTDADAPELPAQPAVKPVAAVAPVSASAGANPASQPDDAPVMEDPPKEGPVKLEFSFGDGNEVKRKPPPKKFGKRPPGQNPKGEKSAPDNKPAKEAPVQPDVSDNAEVPVARGSYSFDFEKFDDLNLNPFGTKTSINNSPKCSKKSSPVHMETAPTEQTHRKVEKESVSPACAEESLPTVDLTPAVQIADNKGPQAEGEPQVPEQSLPEFSELSQPDQKSQADMLDFNDEFVPGTTFMANDFDGQIDYLEQFGSSSFKESALRKQSLYLKFDPLLRESPKKPAGPGAHIFIPPPPPALISCLETQQMAEEQATNGPQQKDGFKLFDEAAAPAPVLGDLVPSFPQPANAEEAIIEVLKYSQKDMDAAIARVQAEAKEKEEQWDAKNKKLLQEGQEMKKIIADLEFVIANMKADQEKERKEAQAKLSKLLKENEQVSSELNNTEKTFADFLKRLNKYKDTIEGYKKNEETLRACAEDSLVRIKKEEQRYQTLKAYAEEKIGRANEEITEVRSKYKAEMATLHVQLRREQLKVQSLEKTLDQKEKETNDLTKLCDELISNVQKG
ncbi:transforming acidic coiled-coil-containing protein 3 isoform X3 [Parambassis ranga]|uniref:Transforming acidic coiled-coil-containing protein 3 isoform X3 n=1 Tax=Parambassis ranga TaxID=210632 RepID=A0A6P7HH60_9TELE|nr:transforming acidic coiled-coil-containing protein 3 isoform X3 [Parambassis ranga]